MGLIVDVCGIRGRYGAVVVLIKIQLLAWALRVGGGRGLGVANDSFALDRGDRLYVVPGGRDLERLGLVGLQQAPVVEGLARRLPRGRGLFPGEVVPKSVGGSSPAPGRGRCLAWLEKDAGSRWPAIEGLAVGRAICFCCSLIPILGGLSGARSSGSGGVAPVEACLDARRTRLAVGGEGAMPPALRVSSARLLRWATQAQRVGAI